MDIKIFVMSHKPYAIPEEDIYIPLQLGNKYPPIQAWKHDNEGINISKKNATYCELSGLYWVWKNIAGQNESDIQEPMFYGFAHYRRLWGSNSKTIVSRQKIEAILKNKDIILPRRRNYLIETNYSHYAHAHHSIELDTTRSIIANKYPGYIEAYDRRMSMRWGHRFNMFIMRDNMMNNYCEWLYDILEELENRLDTSSYNETELRVYGYVAERLLDVWIDKNNYSYAELPIVYVEGEHLLSKGIQMIKRKILNE